MMTALLAALPSDAARCERLNVVYRGDPEGPYTFLSRASDSTEMRTLLLSEGATVSPEDDHDSIDDAVDDDDADALATLLAALSSDELRRTRVNYVVACSWYNEHAEVIGHPCPLLCRARSGEVALLLLDAGADPLAIAGEFDNDDGDALDSAVTNDRADVLAVLLGALRDDSSVTGSDDGSDDEKRILTRQERVNTANPDGTALLMASRSGSVARLLVEAGADVLALDKGGRDAFDTAVANDRADVLGVLLEALPDDVSVNSAYNTGRTLLMAARSVAVTQQLLDAGADPTAVDSEGRDALEHAVGRGHAPVVTTLLGHLGVDAARARVCRDGGSDGSLMSRVHTSLSAHPEVAAAVRAAGAQPPAAGASTGSS
jgi:ankyrin repeat protein